MQQGALWNCGVFAFKLGYLINYLESQGLPIHDEELSRQYNRLPKISFDYEIVEKASNITVMPYDGFWKDLGTWNTLTEEMHFPQIGKGTVSDDSLNVHLIYELDIPIAVLGLSNIVVAASPDGILVTDKDASARVKDLIGSSDQPVMYQERRWGSYKVLDYAQSDEGHHVLTKRICIHAGKNLSYHFHHHKSEMWTVISGKGQLVLNGEVSRVGPGSVIDIQPGTRHGIKAITEINIIEVQMG